MSNINELQKKIAEAEANVIELRKQMDAQRKSERAQTIASVKEIIKTHDLSAADLGLSGKTASKRLSTDKRNSVAPKYLDPISGKTWTGRGKTPGWLSTQVAAGKDKQEFLIQR